VIGQKFPCRPLPPPNQEPKDGDDALKGANREPKGPFVECVYPEGNALDGLFLNAGLTRCRPFFFGRFVQKVNTSYPNAM